MHSSPRVVPMPILANTVAERLRVRFELLPDKCIGFQLHGATLPSETMSSAPAMRDTFPRA